MFKHIKFLQGGSDRYHGILVSIEGLWPNLVSVQQLVRLAALCLTMSTVAFLERGLVLTLIVYVGISIIQVLISLMSRSAAGVLIVWRGGT